MTTTVDAIYENGKLVTIGRVIDPSSRTVPVIFELENPSGRLRIGQFARVYVATGAATSGLAIPESAVLDEGGKPVAYVQLEGERFELYETNTASGSRYEAINDARTHVWFKGQRATVTVRGETYPECVVAN